MGVDIAKLLRQALKPLASTIGLQDATLTKATPGARTPGAIAGGTNPTTADYSCEAMIEVLTVNDVPASIVNVDDRKIGILGASLDEGIIPASGDRIALPDVDGVTKTFRLISPITGDGVGALYEFVARK